MSEHNKGPSLRYVSPITPGGPGQIVDGDGCRLVLIDGTTAIQTDALGRQMAAAPELLEVVRAALRDSGCDGDLCMKGWHEAARAALKKAGVEP